MVASLIQQNELANILVSSKLLKEFCGSLIYRFLSERWEIRVDDQENWSLSSWCHVHLWLVVSILAAGKKVSAVNVVFVVFLLSTLED
jgi:hypothetical protein